MSTELKESIFEKLAVGEEFWITTYKLYDFRKLTAQTAINLGNGQTLLVSPDLKVYPKEQPDGQACGGN